MLPVGRRPKPDGGNLPAAAERYTINICLSNTGHSPGELKRHQVILSEDLRQREAKKKITVRLMEPRPKRE